MVPDKPYVSGKLKRIVYLTNVQERMVAFRFELDTGTYHQVQLHLPELDAHIEKCLKLRRETFPDA